ncbi:poly-gamma-glutamate biosynthesis protein [Candidatus Woesearchaeota archaeon]|nr:poly-gamma-glutamate biosynthesis protein [Candidatus Woesearchaeota archaeon]|tara:strand:+ start:19674 stop:20723 length:1050 start_codon:yes stop_codon:yes gene_type:complete
MNFFYFIIILISVVVTDCTMPQPQTETSSSNNTLLIGLTGDVMLGRLVNEQISVAGYKYPWGDMLSLLQSTDVNLINLETTLTTSNKIVPKVFNFKADPDKVQSLLDARIDVVTIANNHILDFSEEGLIETISVLDKAGINHVGAGVNISEAATPVIITKNNIKIGVLGYTDNEPEWEANDKPGTAYVSVGDIAKVEKEIKKLKEKVDIVIFTIHWGPNQRKKPTQTFINFAHNVIDAGVDIFHGHSAHIFQGIEVYNNKLILYDTGDFVDDYYVTPELRNDQSFLYLITVDKNGIKKVQLVPVLIFRMQVNKATGNDYEEAVNRVKKISKEFGTSVKETDEGVFVSWK